MSESLVILLHGVGSSGADIGGLEPVLAPGLPNTRFAAPDAPGRFNAGHQWFSIIGVTEENRPDRVLAARPAFDSLIAETISRAGFNARLDRVAFVGFSQGSIMALDALASGRWPVAGIVALFGAAGFSQAADAEQPDPPATGSRFRRRHDASQRNRRSCTNSW